MAPKNSIPGEAVLLKQRRDKDFLEPTKAEGEQYCRLSLKEI